MEKIKVPRISLEERIQKENNEDPDFLKVFGLYAADYFSGLSKISRNCFFVDRYNHFIREREGDEPNWLAACMYHIDSIPKEDRELFLYYILIEPFVIIPTFERSADQ